VLFCQKNTEEVRSLTIFQHGVNCTNPRGFPVAPPAPNYFTAMRAHGTSRWGRLLSPAAKAHVPKPTGAMAALAATSAALSNAWMWAHGQIISLVTHSFAATVRPCSLNTTLRRELFTSRWPL
jgi:hypothetical protein